MTWIRVPPPPGVLSARPDVPHQTLSDDIGDETKSPPQGLGAASRRWYVWLRGSRACDFYSGHAMGRDGAFPLRARLGRRSSSLASSPSGAALCLRLRVDAESLPRDGFAVATLAYSW